MDEELDNVVALFRAGKIEEAESAARAFLSRFPEHPIALHFQGLCAATRGSVPEAVALLESAVKIFPEYVEASGNLARLYVTLGRERDAEQCFRQVIAQRADHAPAHHGLGALLARANRHDEAVAELEAAVRLDPTSFRFRKALGDALWLAGREAAAAPHHDSAISYWHGPPDDELFEHLFRRYETAKDRARSRSLLDKWLECDPDNPLASHFLAGLTGVAVPERASDAHVERLFDRFAATFDQQLESAGYAAPALVEAAVRRVVATAVEHTLDGGCGTGLCGVRLRPLSGRLVGVDLSPGMLERARARACYDELVLSELTGYLARHERAFDLAVCADTLVYFGDLTSVLAAFHGAMRDGAHLCFTVEKSVARPSRGSGFELHPHGRYSHAPEYLSAKAREAGLEILHWDEAPVRQEAGAAVMGLIVTARRSGSNALPVNGAAR